MRVVALLVWLVVACRPIDGGVVVRTAEPSTATSATPSSATTTPRGSAAATPAPSAGALQLTEFKVGAGQGPHDVAPATDGGVWYTAQRTGELGYLDPKTGAFKMTRLGSGSAPHGVIVGPDGNPWITDGGLNAIVRVDAKTNEITRYALPAGRGNANLNTATFDKNGTLWFTGQNGVFGRLDVRTGAVSVFDSPRGAGPYGIATCADGSVYYASLASSFIARIDIDTGRAEVIDPPTARQGARRVWCDARSGVWVSEWNAGKLAVYRPTPVSYGWIEWTLPGASPMAYAVFVDDQDIVWVTDWAANAIVRFDPKTEKFTTLPHSAPNADVRQLLGRPGEVWGAMSGQDKLLLVRTR